MHTEIEERVLEIDKDKTIKKLEELGAKKAGEWLLSNLLLHTV